LAADVRTFVDRMPAVRTDKEQIAAGLIAEIEAGRRDPAREKEPPSIPRDE